MDVVRCDEKLILKALKQAVASIQMEEITFTKEEIKETEQKVKIKLLKEE